MFTSQDLHELEEVYAGINPVSQGRRTVHVYLSHIDGVVVVAMRETQEHAAQELGKYYLPRKTGLSGVIKHVMACVRECLMLQTKKDRVYRGRDPRLL